MGRAEGRVLLLQGEYWEGKLALLSQQRASMIIMIDTAAAHSQKAFKQGHTFCWRKWLLAPMLCSLSRMAVLQSMGLDRYLGNWTCC